MLMCRQLSNIETADKFEGIWPTVTNVKALSPKYLPACNCCITHHFCPSSGENERDFLVTGSKRQYRIPVGAVWSS